VSLTDDLPPGPAGGSGEGRLHNLRRDDLACCLRPSAHTNKEALNVRSDLSRQLAAAEQTSDHKNPLLCEGLGRLSLPLPVMNARTSSKGAKMNRSTKRKD